MKFSLALFFSILMHCLFILMISQKHQTSLIEKSWKQQLDIGDEYSKAHQVSYIPFNNDMTYKSKSESANETNLSPDNILVVPLANTQPFSDNKDAYFSNKNKPSRQRDRIKPIRKTTRSINNKPGLNNTETKKDKVNGSLESKISPKKNKLDSNHSPKQDAFNQTSRNDKMDLSGKDNLVYKLIYEPTINYPKQARALGYNKRIKVRVRLTVGIDGSVLSLNIENNNIPDLGFREEALKAVRKMRFEPIVHNNKIITATFIKDIYFLP